MTHGIIWSNEAEHTFENNLEYLERDWNKKTMISFIDRVDDVLKKISFNPKLFPLYKKHVCIHKCVIIRQITVYYKVESTSIILLTFWNTFQNDDRIKF